MRIEHWWFTAPLRLKSIFRRRRVERELDEELQFHLEHKIEEGIADGLSPEEARYRAMRAMGGLDQRKEEMRDARRVHWLTDFVDDVRYAFRSLRRTPGLTAFVVVTLALGIGMTATPFSMLDALIFRPYPVPHPGDVVTLVSTSRDNSFDSFSYREYLDIRDHTKSYDGVIANTAAGDRRLQRRARSHAARSRAACWSPGTTSACSASSRSSGAAFATTRTRCPAAMPWRCSRPDFWKHEFASDPSVVGRTIRLNGTDFTVIGVAPETFPGMYIFARPDFYMPLAMARVFSTNPQKDFFEDRDDRELNVRARLKPGTTLRQARNELAGLARDFEREYPALNRDRGAAVRTQFEMRTRGDDVNWKFGVIFTILALAVLLVACTNVAGLLLSRARTRTREIAVRLALGAGRFRLVRLLLTESLVLALLGGLGGIAVGYAGIRLIGTFTIPAELPVTIPFRMDGRVLLASLALSVLSALALRAGAGAAEHARGPGERAQVGRRRRARAQAALGPQRAGGGAGRHVPDAARGVLPDGPGLPAQRARGDRVREGPPADGAVRSAPRAVRRGSNAAVLRAPGRARAGDARSAERGSHPEPSARAGRLRAASPSCRTAFQMPRDRESFTRRWTPSTKGSSRRWGFRSCAGAASWRPTPRTRRASPSSTSSFAKRYWPGGDAVGKRIRLDGRDGTPVEIVGVARTVKYRAPTERPTDFVYMPLAQQPRGAHGPAAAHERRPAADWSEPVRELVRALDPNMPMLETRTYEDLYRYHAVEGPRRGDRAGRHAGRGRASCWPSPACTGWWPTTSAAGRARSASAWRSARGPADVLRLVMGKGLVLVGIGTAIGLAMGFAVEQLMNAMLFDAGGVDLVVYLVVVPSMVLVTMLAAYVPARRASRIAPTLALRYE